MISMGCRSALGVDLQVFPRVPAELIDHLVGIAVLRVEQAQPLHPRLDGQLHGRQVARVAPVLLRVDRIQQGVLGVEDQQVGVAEELHKAVCARVVLLFVLRVGGIDDLPAVPGERVPVGVSRVILLDRPDRQSGDLVVPVLLEGDEPDIPLMDERGAGKNGLSCWRVMDRLRSR